MDEEKRSTEEQNVPVSAEETPAEEPVKEETPQSQEQPAEQNAGPVVEETAESSEQNEETAVQNAEEEKVEGVEVQKLSAEEQARMIAAQQKADKRYHAVLGDRRVKKPTRVVAIVVTVVILVLVGIFVITKLPMFYNCMTPGSSDTIKGLLAAYQGDEYDTQSKYYQTVSNGSNVWLEWYHLDDNGEEVFKEFLNAPITHDVFANADETLTEKYAQINFYLAKKSSEELLSDEPLRYVTVIMYEFGSRDRSAAYAAKKAEELGGQFEEKNLLFFQLGLAQAKLEGGAFYRAWFNGGNLIEIYASDEELAEGVRTTINSMS